MGGNDGEKWRGQNKERGEETEEGKREGKRRSEEEMNKGIREYGI